MKRKLRKALCGLLLCGLIAGLLPMAALAASTPFYDIAGDAWYAEAVGYVYANKLMSGVDDKTFGPDVEATRGQIVTILYRMAGQPAVSGTARFSDVAANAYYNKAITWASGAGIMSGTGNSLFQPDSAITREQMATVFYRFAVNQKYDVSKSAKLSIFDDAWQISEYARTPLSWAVGSGLMNGTDAKNISPHTLANRAALAATLMRFCNLYNIKVPTVTTVAAAPAATTAVTTTAAAPAVTTAAATAAAPAATTAAAAVSGDQVSTMTLDGSTIQTPRYTFQWPVQGSVSSGYGYRDIFGSTSFHRGIDIPAPQGTAVHAGQGGTVTFVGEQGSYGNLVIIDHGNGFQSYYAHNSVILVEKGDVVQKNDVISGVGSTGRSTGNHCHFELHYKGQVIDPMDYLPEKNDAPARTVVAAALDLVQEESVEMTQEMLVLAAIY